MGKKEIFIKEIEELVNMAIESNIGYSGFTKEASDYFEALKSTSEKEPKKFTENGKLVLSFMKENKDNFNNIFKSKDIAEAIGVSTRTVSGAMRKLITDGYIEKIESSPICYSLTDKGKTVEIEVESNEEENNDKYKNLILLAEGRE